ncbi:MAG: rhamnulokinase [Actinobacteria bacterium]|nr:MAG: rhamnulokinase [Actinomycetota bacterium]
MSTPVIAIDFGANSIRVCRVELGDAYPRLDMVHRYEHHAVRGSDGHLRWDWQRLVVEMRRGLELAMEVGPVASIGIDTWGLDYGLLDAAGDLVEAPFSHRDDRTRGYRRFVEQLGERRLYEIAGLPLRPSNTIFQLAAHGREALERARHVVMLPELLVYHLTGEIAAERTSAGTSGLLDLRTGTWSAELCDAIGLEAELFPEIWPVGTQAGRWRGVPVHLVGGHDTASAVVAGAVEGEAFVSSGTWLIVGREQLDVETTEQAQRAGFSNEQGALGGIRFLRNAAGWWMLEECRRYWGAVDVATMLREASAVRADGLDLDVTDERLFAPSDMEAELRAAAGLGPDANRPTITRTIVESMAATTAKIVSALGNLHGIRLFGGGSRSDLYIEALRARTELTVSVGPVEATALGNALTQGFGLGQYDSLTSIRSAVAGSV